MRSLTLSLALLGWFSLTQTQAPEHVSPDPPQTAFEPHHAEMIGQFLPDISFVARNDQELALSTFLGRPLLIDVWATWCGPCLTALPTLNHVYSEFKSKGMEMISFDEDGEQGEDGDAATAARYLARHRYFWKNVHDADSRVATALQCDGLPLVVLADARGKIVYFDFGGSEANLRKAIATLGPDFAPASPPDKDNADQASSSPDQN